MLLNLESMLRIVRTRTGVRNNDPYLTDELNSAGDWAFNRLFALNESIIKEEDEQLTLAAQTSSYDLGAAVARPDMYAVKWLGVKLGGTGNDKFNPVTWMDSSSDVFMSADQDQPATGFPIYCATKNFSQVRFAPPLPAGTQIMVTYVWIGLPFNLDTNASLASSTYPGLPNPINQSIVDKATAQVFLYLDDTRFTVYEGMAHDKLRNALNVVGKRQLQQPARIKGFRRRVVRGVW